MSRSMYYYYKMSLIKLSIITVLLLITLPLVIADELVVNPAQTKTKPKMSDDERRLKLIEQLRAATNPNSPDYIPTWSDKVVSKIKANITFNGDKFLATH